MDIEAEIARALDEAFDAWDGKVSEPQFVASRLMPLVKRAQAEAWADAIASVHARVGADGMLDQHALIRLTNPYIEQGGV